LLPLPKWISHSRNESLEKGDLIYMKKREQSSHSPLYTTAIIEEVKWSEDDIEREIRVRYVAGGRYGDDKEESDDEDNEKRQKITKDGERIVVRYTMKDARAVVKLYPIEDDLNKELREITQWLEKLGEKEADSDTKETIEDFNLPGSLASIVENDHNQMTASDCNCCCEGHCLLTQHKDWSEIDPKIIFSSFKM
jgi:hypothetical protein